PCLAFGTPVIFLFEDLDDIRFGGLLKFLKVYTTGDKWDIPDNFTNKKDIELETLIQNLNTTVTTWIKNKIHLFDCAIEQNGNSIISVCMDRNAHLERSLESWIAAE